MDIKISIDARGFVYYDDIKLPFKYNPETKEIQFKIKNPYQAKQYKDGMLNIKLIEVQILPLLYPVSESGIHNWICNKCSVMGISNFKGILINGIIQFKCLQCDHVFAQFSKAQEDIDG